MSKNSPKIKKFPASFYETKFDDLRKVMAEESLYEKEKKPSTTSKVNVAAFFPEWTNSDGFNTPPIASNG